MRLHLEIIVQHPPPGFEDEITLKDYRSPSTTRIWRRDYSPVLEITVQLLPPGFEARVPLYIADCCSTTTNPA